MRGVKIQISGELLLDLMGLRPGNITLSTATIEWPNILELVLTGEDERLPEIKNGDILPNGIIICKTINSHIEVVEARKE